MKHGRLRLRNESGQVLVLLTVAVAVLLGVAALVVDLGNRSQKLRQAQSSADSAVLAGAQEFMSPFFYYYSPPDWPSAIARVKNYVQVNFGTDPNTGWSSCSDEAALAYLPDTANSDECISADREVNPTRLRVRIPTTQLSTAFARAFGTTSPISKSASAVATIQPGHLPCAVCILGSSGTTLDQGTSDLNVVGGSIVVNSNAHTGDSASVAAPSIAVWGTASGDFTPAPVKPPSPVLDPLAALAAPTFDDSKEPDDASPGGTLSPGVYHNITTSNGTLTLSPGIYIITGTFSPGVKGSIVGNNVLLFFPSCASHPNAFSANCSSWPGGTLNADNQESIKLSPPNASTCTLVPATCPYVGMSVFYDRNNTSTISFGAGADLDVSGTIYAAAATMDIDAGAGANALHSALIVGKLTSNGHSQIIVTYDNDENFEVDVPTHFNLYE